MKFKIVTFLWESKVGLFLCFNSPVSALWLKFRGPLNTHLTSKWRTVLCVWPIKPSFVLISQWNYNLFLIWNFFKTISKVNFSLWNFCIKLIRAERLDSMKFVSKMAQQKKKCFIGMCFKLQSLAMIHSSFRTYTCNVGILDRNCCFRICHSIAPYARLNKRWNYWYK